MKILKKILIGIVALIALVLIIAIFVKRDYKIERSATINQPKATVFNYIKLQKNQDHYSKWVMTDPKMKKTYEGTDGEAGFVYAWDSQDDHVGKGEQEIKAISEGDSVLCEIRFKKPFENTANTAMSTMAITEAQTKVTWNMSGRSPYPLNFMNLFMSDMLGKDMETSLNNLKTVLEKQ